MLGSEQQQHAEPTKYNAVRTRHTTNTTHTSRKIQHEIQGVPHHTTSDNTNKMKYNQGTTLYIPDLKNAPGNTTHTISYMQDKAKHDPAGEILHKTYNTVQRPAQHASQDTGQAVQYAPDHTLLAAEDIEYAPPQDKMQLAKGHVRYQLPDTHTRHTHGTTLRTDHGTCTLQ